MHYAIPYKGYMLLNIISNIFYALFSVLSFIALIPMLNILFEKGNEIHSKPQWQGIKNMKDYFFDFMNFHLTSLVEQYGKSSALFYMVGVVITMFLLKNMFNYLAMFFITYLRNGVLRDIRNDLYNKTINLPIAFFSEKRKGDIMSRITSDVLEIQHSFLSMLEFIVKEPLTIIFTLVGMFVLSPKLTIFVLIFIPVSGFIISLIGKQLRKNSALAQKEQGHFLSLIEETLIGLKVVKAFNAENLFVKLFQKSTQKFYELSNKILHRQNLAAPMSEFLGILVIAVLLWVGGKMVLIDGALQAADFISFMGLSYNILTPAKQISKAFYSLKRGDAAAERVLEVLNMPDVMEDKIDAFEKNTFEDKIVYENVSFKYEDNWILQNFNLTIKKGQTVALVGQSGSGKTTLAALLSRFYDVDEGKITIDGIDVKNLKKQSVRGLSGLVTQESILFNDSVKNNIIFGKENITDEDVIKAAQIANAHEFIDNMPQKYETNIGDAGGKLSGGQKQRLSIARAVLKNPPIMILDEATSALDTESERLVQKALENMMENRTSLVIAHRLSTVQKADLIVVLQNGKIMEQGTHTELINHNGIYRRLVEMQEL